MSSQDLREFAHIADFDRAEIDNRNPRHPARIQYQHRLDTVLSLAARWFTPGSLIGDFGAAQGNMGLLLAERAYRVVAVDRQPGLLHYSSRKYERGDLHWVCGDFQLPPLAPSVFAGALIGEIVTMSADPASLLRSMLNLLRPSAVAIITIPNSSRLDLHLPSLTKAAGGAAARPAGSFDHVVKITPAELQRILPGDCEWLCEGYCGGTILLNRFTWWVQRLVPASLLARFEAWLSARSAVRRFVARTYYAVVRTSSEIHAPEGRQSPAPACS